MVSVNISSILFQEYNRLSLVLTFSSWGIFHTPSVSHSLIHSRSIEHLLRTKQQDNGASVRPEKLPGSARYLVCGCRQGLNSVSYCINERLIPGCHELNVCVPTKFLCRNCFNHPMWGLWEVIGIGCGHEGGWVPLRITRKLAFSLSAMGGDREKLVVCNLEEGPPQDPIWIPDVKPPELWEIISGVYQASSPWL